MYEAFTIEAPAVGGQGAQRPLLECQASYKMQSLKMAGSLPGQGKIAAEASCG